MKLQLTKIFQKVSEGYIGFVEELLGANTQGATLEEARANLQEAVVLVLETNRELAERSITLVRGPLEPLPLQATILAVMPQPTDLTPADTSSMVAPGLGRALRQRFRSVDEVVVGIAPTEAG